jgi:hypothetical protein
MALNGFARVLSWRDFQGPVPEEEEHIAETVTRVRCAMGYGWSRNAYRYNDRLVVNIVMLTGESWAKTSGRTDRLLRHEQGHYDISAIVGREIHRRLVGFTSETESDMQAEFDRVVGEGQALLNQLQSNDGDGLYDVQTNHALNTDAQARWNQAFVAARASAAMTMREALAAQGITV